MTNTKTILALALIAAAVFTTTTVYATSDWRTACGINNPIDNLECAVDHLEAEVNSALASIATNSADIATLQTITLVNGTDGQDGAQGIQGIAGIDGTDGLNGLDGSDGATGPQGIQGETGTSNQAQVDALQTQLAILQALHYPDQLTITDVHDGDAELTVFWNELAPVIHTPVLSYTGIVTNVITGVETEVTLAAPASGMTISGLTNDETYDIELVATNSLGDSPAAIDVGYPSSPQIPPAVPNLTFCCQASGENFFAQLNVSQDSGSSPLDYTIMELSYDEDFAIINGTKISYSQTVSLGGNHWEDGVIAYVRVANVNEQGLQGPWFENSSTVSYYNSVQSYEALPSDNITSDDGNVVVTGTIIDSSGNRTVYITIESPSGYTIDVNTASNDDAVFTYSFPLDGSGVFNTSGEYTVTLESADGGNFQTQTVVFPIQYTNLG